MTIKSQVATAAPFRPLMIYRLSKIDSHFPYCLAYSNIIRSLYYMDELV